MHPILFHFALPKFFEDWLGSIPTVISVFIAGLGLAILFWPLPKPPKPEETGETDPDRVAEAIAAGAKRRQQFALWTFIAGLVFLVFGVLCIGVGLLSNETNEHNAQEFWSKSKNSINRESFLNLVMSDSWADIHGYLDPDHTERTGLPPLASIRNQELRDAISNMQRVASNPEFKYTVAWERLKDLMHVMQPGNLPDRLVMEQAWDDYTKGYNPDNYRLLPVEIPSYGVMVMLGFIAAIAVTYMRARQYGIDPNIVIDIGIIGMVAGIAGARIWYIVEYWSDHFAVGSLGVANFWDSIVEMVSIQNGGLVYYGGFIGASLALTAYLYIRKQPFWLFADFVGITVPLGHAFGRLGCFLNGCCYGGECSADSFLAVHMPHADSTFGQITPIYASQLVASVSLMASFILLTLYYTKVARKRGEAFFLMLTFYAVNRFLNQMLREDVPLYDPLGILNALGIGFTRHAAEFNYGFASSQWLSLMVFLVALPLLFYFRYSRPQEKAAHLAGLPWHPFKGSPPPRNHFLRPFWVQKVETEQQEAAAAAEVDAEEPASDDTKD